MKKEVAPCWDLAVTVLRAKFSSSHDYFSQSDLYVILRMPTASVDTVRTKSIPNSNSPEWNETFHFRVNSHVKNILELDVYDEDLRKDDLCIRLFFDISNLTLGKKETKVFITDDKKKDELWVDFEITECPEASREYLSNGVLVAAKLSIVEVKIDKLPPEVGKNMLLTLRGAYNQDQIISTAQKSNLMQTLRYYISKDLEPMIELQADGKEASSTSPPVSPLSNDSTSEYTFSFPKVKDTVNLQVNTVESSEEDMKVRLDFDIPAEEKAFLEKRREVVSRALQKILNLKSPLHPSKVPTVAVVCTGGGSRAMTGMFGCLKGLQSLGLLDAISYITSLSGSTWTNAYLYNDPHWSEKDLDEAINSVKKELSKGTKTLFGPTRLRYYYSELRQKQKEGHNISPIDMWGLIIENAIYGKKNTATLSDQQGAVSEGQNPLPIYTAVNMKRDAGGSVISEWCEFTPYEVGFPKYGGFVPSEHFGSEYYLGHLVKKLPEIRVSFLLGTWSSVFSASLMLLWKHVTGSMPSWTSWLGEDASSIETDDDKSTLDTVVLGSQTSTLSDFMHGRPMICKVYNFLRGFFLHNKYSERSTFNTRKETNLDAFPNRLTPMDRTLDLVDAGFEFNSAFPPVLRPERNVNVVLSLSFSWDEDHLKILKETQKYCADRELPFPNIDFSKFDGEPPKEVYVFEDEENPDAPIVVHFPLVNISFKEFKAPGVKRQGREELKAGNVDVSSGSSPYTTSNLTYDSEDFQRLVDLTCYNVSNNLESIVCALERALNRKELAGKEK
ncbi:cytosolic phospholipase A2 zeta-like [Tachysurus fulvidraco]|uniref:cytosolic phospholipase A2 zeta-like n=1 Tax=Tachysurus fulvidraco TaxID=1234273 RepID=UPI001FED56FE|nr:cytosolic phospholipase A2 zeta-like [Tachysurus fulvidraco]